KVLGIDRFQPPHDKGSSHGETRMIRKAYHEHVDYVPLVQNAYRLWHELEERTSQKLYYETGLFFAAPPEGSTITGAKLAARLHHLRHEIVPREDFRDRFPGFELPEGFDVFLEHEAGYLLIDDCQRAHLDLARSLGAELHGDETVISWKPEGASVAVETNRGRYTADRLVMTAGPWAGQVLSSLNIPLKVVRKTLFWFPIRNENSPLFSPGTCYFYDLPWGEFYGFHCRDGRTLKMADHAGGEDVVDPLTVDRTVTPRDYAGFEKFLAIAMPDVSPVPVKSSVCMYTRTPDGNFVVDRHPEHPQVVIGCGFSGHGFKFTSVIGEALAQLSLDGRTEHPIGFLSLDRPALCSNE
ncbi:MAG: N-methyl-L-tryptophan oxidase, partial [Planctomycetota bacterium]|nr:N-methyl-L-tryptophan oxidase [Planctomycetota bacterium]